MSNGTSPTIEPDDFALAPPNQRCGLRRAYAVVGERLAPLLRALNEVLVG